MNSVNINESEAMTCCTFRGYAVSIIQRVKKGDLLKIKLYYAMGLAANPINLMVHIHGALICVGG